MSVPLRRRLENLSLRWQARLDSEWADRVLPWIATVAMFVVLALLALARARSLEGTADLAAYTQAAWLVGEGQPPVTTITTGSHVLAQQAAFLFYPMVLPSMAGVPIVANLLVVQAAALASGILPLWRIARKVANLRPGPSLCLVFVYGFYPTVHNLNLAGFHPEVVGLPGLLGAIYFGLRGKWRYFVVCAVMAVLSRADLGLALAGLGALLAVEGKRRPGLVTMGVGSAWTVVCTFVVQPRYGAGSSAHITAFTAFGDTPGAVVGGLLTHPSAVIQQLVREQNFNLAVTLLAPLVFLPVLVPRYLLPVLPLQFLYLVADIPRDAVFGQQTVAITAFLFLGAAMALGKLGEVRLEKIRVDNRLIGALFLAATVFFVQDAASSPYRHPWDWGGRDTVDYARLRTLERVEAATPVRVSPSLLTVFSERPTVFALVPADSPDAAAAAAGVDAVVIDDRQLGPWTTVDRQVFRLGLDSLGFSRVSEEEGIEVFVRSGRR